MKGIVSWSANVGQFERIEFCSNAVSQGQTRLLANIYIYYLNIKRLREFILVLN